MRRKMIWQLAVLVLAVEGFSTAAVGQAASGSEQTHPQLLPGDRILIGTVVEALEEDCPPAARPRSPTTTTSGR